jgi:hypothetical protein
MSEELKTAYYLTSHGVTRLGFGESFDLALTSGRLAAVEKGFPQDEISIVGPVWVYKLGEELPVGAQMVAQGVQAEDMPEGASVAILVTEYAVEILDTENRVYTYKVCALTESQAKEFAWERADENFHGPRAILSVS